MIDHGAVTRSEGGRFLNKFCFGSNSMFREFGNISPAYDTGMAGSLIDLDQGAFDTQNAQAKVDG